MSDLLPETVYVTFFMEDLRTGVTRTEFFRFHFSIFAEAVRIAQNTEHNFKSARLCWNGYNPSFSRATSANTLAYCKPKQMDFGNAEDECEAELHVRINSRK